MKIIYNKLIPFHKFLAINLFGILFVRNKVILNDEILNHELIHSAQMKELLYLGFYILYIFEWFIKLFVYGKNSYQNISFEREAHIHDENLNYLQKRNRYAWIKYL